MLLQRVINGSFDQIAAIFMQNDIDKIALNFKSKYN